MYNILTQVLKSHKTNHTHNHRVKGASLSIFHTVIISANEHVTQLANQLQIVL